MSNVSIREATPEDVDIIFAWANDKEARRNSFNPEPIPYENHCRWYQNKMESDDTYIFVLMADNTPIGQCRLDIKNSEALISYIIDPEYRGKGYGKKLLELIYDKAKTSIPEILTLTAEVKEENIPSKRVFLSLGYTESVDEANKVLTFRRKIK